MTPWRWRWTSPPRLHSEHPCRGAEVRPITRLVNAAGVSPSQAPIEGDFKGGPVRQPPCYWKKWARSLPRRRGRDHLQPVRPPYAGADPGAGRAAGLHPHGGTAEAGHPPAGEYSGYPPRYQMAKRCNEKRVMAESVKWGEKGARINAISPASSSRRWRWTSLTASAAISTRICSPNAPPAVPAQRMRWQMCGAADERSGCLHHRGRLPHRRRRDSFLFLWPAEAEKLKMQRNQSVKSNWLLPRTWIGRGRFLFFDDRKIVHEKIQMRMPGRNWCPMWRIWIPTIRSF